MCNLQGQSGEDEWGMNVQKREAERLRAARLRKQLPPQACHRQNSWNINRYHQLLGIVQHEDWMWTSCPIHTRREKFACSLDGRHMQGITHSWYI